MKKFLRFLLVLILSSPVFAQYSVSSGGVGLKVFVGPGKNFITNQLVTWSGGYLTLPQNSTSYIYVDAMSGLPTANQTGFPAGCVPLRLVITGVDSVISSIDQTVDFVSGSGSAAAITGITNQIVASPQPGAVQIGLANPAIFPGPVGGPGPLTVNIGPPAFSSISLSSDPACGLSANGIDQICPLQTPWGTDLLTFNTGAAIYAMLPVCPIEAAPTANQSVGWNTASNCFAVGNGISAASLSSNSTLTIVGGPTPVNGAAGNAICSFDKINSNSLLCSYNNGIFLRVPQSIAATLTTTAATTDNVAVPGMTATGRCFLTPTNSGAAAGIASVFVSAKTTNQITVTHTATSGWTFDVICTPQ